MTEAQATLYHGTAPEKIGLFGLSRYLPLIQSSFEALPYFFESHSDLAGFHRWVSKDNPRIILLEGKLFDEMQSEAAYDRLREDLRKLGIPSLVIIHSRDEIKKWSEAWPKAHFFLGPVTAQAIRKKISAIMAEGLFPEMPLAAIFSEKPFFTSHLEMLFKNVGLRVMVVGGEKTRDHFRGQLAAQPDFYVWDASSKIWPRDEVKKMLSLIAPGKNVPGFAVADSLLPGSERELYRLDQPQKLMEAILMSLKKEKNIELKPCRDHTTGLYLPGIFMELLEREMKLAHRTGEKLSVLRINLGNLQEMEESFGPIFVHELEIHLGLFIQNRVRATDLVARVQRGEILLMLTRVTRDLASLIGERLHHSFVKEASFPDGASKNFTPQFDYEILTFPDDVSDLNEVKEALSAPSAASLAEVSAKS
ncbi:MAG: diguanylate cyclase [Deltaproteobacteria bacterium]|nr:diguanylate cyclase [Deltaproteobacteria bacterium]